MNDIAFYNGEFLRHEEAFTNVEDRGNNFGDGVYDVVCCFNKKPLNIEKHVDRFFNSMSAIDINSPYTKDQVKDIILQAIDKSDIDQSLIYFQMTRGCAMRSHVYKDGMIGNFYLAVRKKPSYEKYRKVGGAPIISTVDDRWTRCDIKSLNLLANVMAAKKASRVGCIEALLIRDGVAAECTASSIFYVKDDVLFTEPLSPLILAGINRGKVVDIAKKIGVKLIEKQSTIDEFYQADEVFMTSATKLIVNVNKIDDIEINKKHPISDKLYDAYIDEVVIQCGAVDKDKI